jgi:glycosyltransferase involved in cell wall biosynthesis
VKKLFHLLERYPWWSTQSGYDRIFTGITASDGYAAHHMYLHARSAPSVLRPALRCLKKKAYGMGAYDADRAWDEVRALWRARVSPIDLIHHTSIDESYGLLRLVKRFSDALLVGTLHQPYGMWRLWNGTFDNLKALDALVIMSSAELDLFARHIERDKIHFIPYATNTDFWTPGSSSKDPERPLLLFCGTWLRDFETLANVVDRVVASKPEVRFALVMNSAYRSRLGSLSYRLARHAQVEWYEGISDERLLELYRESTALFLPMLNAAANNAVLEAMACGTPVVSNEVGGLSDYVTDACGCLLPVGDADAMFETVMELMQDHARCRQMGSCARARAVDLFSESIVRKQYTTLYDTLLAD